MYFATLSLIMLAFNSLNIFGFHETKPTTDVLIVVSNSSITSLSLDSNIDDQTQTSHHQPKRAETASAFAAADCPNGFFCAFSGVNASGSYIAFSSCYASNSVNQLGAVRSVVNKRSSGNVTVFNGSTARYTVANGATLNVSGTITRLGC